MKKSEVKIGSVYTAVISGKLTNVRIDSEIVRTTYRGINHISGKLNKTNRAGWTATNLTTGKKVQIKSAAKLRRLVSEVHMTQAPIGPGYLQLSESVPVQRFGGQYAPAVGSSTKDREPVPSAEEPSTGATEKPTAQLKLQVGPEAAQTPSSPTEGPRKAKTGKLGSLKSLLADQGATITPKPDGGSVVRSTELVGGKRPTEEQWLVIEAAQEKPNVLIVFAGAGTGKTTNLRMLADVLRGMGQYTAFNKNLVNDSKGKFQGTKVSCNTTHSLAFRGIGKKYAHRLNGNRVRSEQIARHLGIDALTLKLQVQGKELEKRLAPGYLAGQMMMAIARFCQSAERSISERHFKYIDGIDMPEADGRRGRDNNDRVRQYLLPFAHKAWADLIDEKGQLPFSHDHYVKIWQLNNPVIDGDFILLDEAQDTAPVMLDVIKQQTAPVIIVGDSAQQIYQWRGAVDALSAFPGAPVCYLSQSFRFGEAIADVANLILEQLMEPTKLRLKGLASIPSRLHEIEKPSCVLCRTNAMAVTTLLGAIAKGQKPHLVGGGSEVVAFVEAADKLQQGQPTSHPELACFSNWTEVQEYSTLDEGSDLKLMVKLIDGFTCQVILDGLKNMVDEKHADTVICTAHKSKGREWNYVKVASDFPKADKSTDDDWRLLYVTVTRAKLGLDITECPTFNGKDALDVKHIVAKYKDNDNSVVAEMVGSLAPTHAEMHSATTIEQPRATNALPTEFTWAKSKDGGWVVRGPSGYSGKAVDVVRKDGSSQCKKLGSIVWEEAGISLYRV